MLDGASITCLHKNADLWHSKLVVTTTLIVPWAQEMSSNPLYFVIYLYIAAGIHATSMC